MKKFEYNTAELDASNENCLDDFFSNDNDYKPGELGWELITVLPFQKIVKMQMIGAQPKVMMRLMLIFKREVPCQE